MDEKNVVEGEEGSGKVVQLFWGAQHSSSFGIHCPIGLKPCPSGSS